MNPSPGWPESSKTALAEEATGLPGFRKWGQVYLFVFGFFVLTVVLLAVLTRVFS
jgi:hypothetical protein